MALEDTLHVLNLLDFHAPRPLDVDELGEVTGMVGEDEDTAQHGLRGVSRRLAHLVSKGAACEMVTLQGKPPRGRLERRIWDTVKAETALPPVPAPPLTMPLVFVAARLQMPVNDLRRKLNEHRQNRRRSGAQNGLSLVRVWTITERGREILAQEST